MKMKKSLLSGDQTLAEVGSLMKKRNEKENFALTKSSGREAVIKQNGVNPCPDTLCPHGEYPLETEIDKVLDLPISFCACNPNHFLFRLPM